VDSVDSTYKVDCIDIVDSIDKVDRIDKADSIDKSIDVIVILPRQVMTSETLFN